MPRLDARRCRWPRWLLLLGSSLALGTVQAATLTPLPAKDHVGENATVCGIKV